MTPPTTLQPDSAWRMHALLRQRLAQPFAWGVRDCAMLPFDVVLATTGRDVAADLRGAYSTARQAWRLLRGMGGLQGMAAARFGAPVDWPDARDGDVILVDAGVCTAGSIFGGALGVCWRGIGVAQGPSGLVQVPGTAVRRCWAGC